MASEVETLREALAKISLAERDTTTAAADKVRDMARIARAALAYPYNAARIAWELERTAMGDGYHGNALRVAKDIPGLTDEDRALLDRYATGRNSGTDHVALQDLALRIDRGSFGVAPAEAPSSARDRIAPLLNAFGELHWRSGRGHDVSHEQIADTFETIIAAADGVKEGQEPEPSVREQTLAGLVKRLAWLVPKDHAARIVATECLQKFGYLSPLREGTAGVEGRKP
jgi:hypothetical protein